MRIYSKTTQNLVHALKLRRSITIIRCVISAMQEYSV